MEKHINELQLMAFKRHLRLEEREPATIEKYLRDVHAFTAWLGGRPLDKEATVAWKGHLLASGHAPSTVNPMLIAVNRFFRFQHWDELRVKTVRIQRKIFRSTEKELSREEYLRLLETADALGKPRLSLLMEVICATGIRVSEVKYITVEAARAGRAEMKAICKQSGVAPSKVFRHNLRHLFARTFYKSCRDVVMWCSLRMCWAIPALKPPEFTLFSQELSMSGA